MIWGDNPQNWSNAKSATGTFYGRHDACSSIYLSLMTWQHFLYALGKCGPCALCKDAIVASRLCGPNHIILPWKWVCFVAEPKRKAGSCSEMLIACERWPKDIERSVTPHLYHDVVRTTGHVTFKPCSCASYKIQYSKVTVLWLRSYISMLKKTLLDDLDS